MLVIFLPSYKVTSYKDVNGTSFCFAQKASLKRQKKVTFQRACTAKKNPACGKTHSACAHTDTHDHSLTNTHSFTHTNETRGRN